MRSIASLMCDSGDSGCKEVPMPKTKEEDSHVTFVNREPLGKQSSRYVSQGLVMS